MNFSESSNPMNLNNKIGTRRSTQVNQPPGGSSSVIIGSEEPPRQARPVREVVPAANPINWGELKAAPKSSPAVAKAGAADRMKNSPYATAAPPTAAPKLSTVPSSPVATPWGTADNVENVPPSYRSGRKVTGAAAAKEDRGGLLTWEPPTAAEKAAEAAEDRTDRISGGGRTSISLGSTAAPALQPSGRVPPGGASSFNLSHH